MWWWISAAFAQDPATRQTIDALTAFEIGLLGVALALGGGWMTATLLQRRRARTVSARHAFAAARKTLADRLDEAVSRFLDAGLEDRATYAALEDAKGETALEVEQVRREVEELYNGLQALKLQLQQSAEIVGKAGAYTPGAVEAQTRALAQPFTREIGALPLAAGAPAVVEVDPEAFCRNVLTRIAAIRPRFARLKQAAEARLLEARAHLPHNRLDALLARAEAAGIPPAWLSAHPLFGDDASDAAFWSRLDAMRFEDPLAYLEHVEANQDLERQLDARLKALEAAVSSVSSARLEVAPTHPPGTYAPEDDPAKWFSWARAHEQSLAVLMERCALTDDAAPVLVEAEKACAAYTTAEERAQELRAAAAHLRNAEETFTQQAAALRQRSETVHRNLTRAREVHTGLEAVAGLLADAERSIQAMERLEGQMEAMSARGEMTLAEQIYARRHRLLDSASERLDAAIAHVDRAESARHTYQEHVAHLPERYRNSLDQLQALDPNATLTPLFEPKVIGPADYPALLAALLRQERQWEADLRQARAAHFGAAQKTQLADLRLQVQRAREAQEKWRRSAAYRDFVSLYETRDPS